MSRLHVHIAVDDIEQNIRFYSALFGNAPSVTRTDYAKWVLDEPSVNFAISSRGANRGEDAAPAGCCFPRATAEITTQYSFCNGATAAP